MTLKFFLVVLAGLIILTAGVSAQNEMNESGSLPDSGENVTISEDGSSRDISLFTEETAGLFQDFDESIMRVAERIYNYLVSGDEESRQAFVDEYASFKENITAFEEAIDLNSESAAVFKAEYDELTAAVDSMGTLGEKMVASYEVNTTVDTGDFAAFEAEVDRAMTAQESVYSLGFDSGNGTNSAHVYRIFLGESLDEAIKESYGYLVLGNTTEKEEAVAAFTAFDETVAAAEKQYPDESYDDLKKIKADLMQQAEKVFTTYETEGVINVDEFAEFESLVSSFYMAMQE